MQAHDTHEVAQTFYSSHEEPVFSVYRDGLLHWLMRASPPDFCRAA